MKKYYCTLFFAMFASAAFCQHKQGFGFVLKGGIHNFPEKQDSYYDFSTTRHDPGSLYSLGIWQKIPLTPRLHVTWELLYRAAFFGKRMTNPNTTIFVSNSIGQAVGLSGQVFIQQRHVSSSFSLPVKLEYYPRRSHRFALFGGLGVSHKFAERVHSTVEYSTSVDINFKKVNPPQTLPLEAFDLLGTLCFGAIYHIDRQTSLGIEFIYEPIDTEYYYYYRLVLPNEIVFYDDPLPLGIRSLSVSLRHALFN